MIIRSFAPLFIAAMLSACAVNQGHEDLRAASLNDVRTMGLWTRPFLEKNGEAKTMSTAQDYIRSKMKDPDGTKFQNVRIADYGGGKVICGQVNGKNSYGGYVGYKKFAAGISAVMIYDTDGKFPEISDAYNAGIIDACGNN